MKKVFLPLFATLLLLSCQETLEEKAAREARLYTLKNCPSKVDDYIISDSLTFDAATHTLSYYYTMTGFADSAELVKPDVFREVLLGQLANTTSMAPYKEAGYRFAYVYHSQKHPSQILFETVFTKDDYTKAQPARK